MRQLLKDFKPARPARNGSKAALEFVINCEPQQSMLNVSQTLTYDLTEALLYSDENMSESTSLLLVLRAYLVLKGFEYRANPETYQLIRGIANCFLPDNKDTQLNIPETSSQIIPYVF